MNKLITVNAKEYTELLNHEYCRLVSEFNYKHLSDTKVVMTHNRSGYTIIPKEKRHEHIAAYLLNVAENNLKNKGIKLIV